MSRSPKRFRGRGQVLGLPVAVDVRDAGFGSAVRDGFAWLRDVDRRFCSSQEDSRSCRQDWGCGAEPGCDLCEAIELADRYEHWSRAFDASPADRRIGRRGVVAGWAVQRFAEWLRAVGAENFRIDVGGGVITAGEPEAEQRWRVGIRHPWRMGRMCAVLSLTDRAVATSAHDAQGAHIVPDRTPRWATELASLTVIAADLAVAEATAAAALVMGRDGIAWADTQPGCLVFAVTADGLLQRSTDANDLIEHV